MSAAEVILAIFMDIMSSVFAFSPDTGSVMNVLFGGMFGLFAGIGQVLRVIFTALLGMFAIAGEV